MGSVALLPALSVCSPCRQASSVERRVDSERQGQERERALKLARTIQSREKKGNERGEAWTLPHFYHLSYLLSHHFLLVAFILQLCKV